MLRTLYATVGGCRLPALPAIVAALRLCAAAAYYEFYNFVCDFIQFDGASRILLRIFRASPMRVRGVLLLA